MYFKVFFQFLCCKNFWYKMRRNFLFLVLFGTLTVMVLLYNQRRTLKRKFYFLPEISIVSTDQEFPHHIENLPDIHFADEVILIRHNRTCARYPQLFDVKFTSDHWQTQEVTNGTLHLFSAYLDDREVEKNWSVRVVGMGIINPNQTLYCQVWLNNTEVFITSGVKILKIWFDAWVTYNEIKLYQPYLITCPLPRNETPGSVSIVENPCDYATNNLRISHGTIAKKKNFVVCVKGLSFPREDRSVRLVEWIELLRILGAEKITFYKFAVHPRMERVLDYYSRNGGIEVVPFSLLGGVSNNPHIQEIFLRTKLIERRLQEVIPYNDCLYKHLQEYKFVVILDIDEVILPSKGGTWVQLIKTLGNLSRSSYMARNIYFFEELDSQASLEGIPAYMYMLQHVFRAKDPLAAGYFTKGFHDVSRVLALHNHYPLNCLKDCNDLSVDVEVMQLQHYRKDCFTQMMNCSLIMANTVKDTRIWRYKDQLIRNVQKALIELNFLNAQS